VRRTGSHTGERWAHLSAGAKDDNVTGTCCQRGFGLAAWCRKTIFELGFGHHLFQDGSLVFFAKTSGDENAG